MNPIIPVVIGVGAIALFASKDAEASIDYSPSPSDPPIDYGKDMSGNIDAFLQVIKIGESNDNYRALLGGGNFSSFSDHPVYIDGFKGVGNSHAAGAYQFQPGTWKEAQAALGLPDFSPSSQDAAAIYLIRRRGAYDDIAMGRIDVAVGKLAGEWEMFKTSKWSVSTVITHFTEYGGNVA